MVMSAEFIVLIVLGSMAAGVYMGKHWDYFTSEE